MQKPNEPQTGGQPESKGTPPSPTGAPQGTGLAPNIASLLCYICMPITSIIFLIIEKEDKDVQFHAWQGAIFGVGSVVVLFAVKFLAAILSYIINVLGAIVDFMIWIIVIAFFILWIVCMIKAYQGERWKIPYVGDYAAKKAGV